MSGRKKRSKTGCAISAERRNPEALGLLDAFTQEARAGNRLDEWRRGVAVRRYIDGEKVTDIATQVQVRRGSVNQWLRWYDTMGSEGLRNRKAPGASPKLSAEQMGELADIVEAGPQAAGFDTGMWTGPMVGQVIRERFGVSYHNHHVPVLLHRLGFSVQRPRKRLSRADAALQEEWVKERLPAIKKKRRPVEE